MTDNPTPSPRNSGPPATGGFDTNRPTIISLLYLAGFVTGITGFVGVVLAHIWQGESDEPWLASHYTYLIRTFWIGLAASIVGAILTLVLIGLPLLLAAAVWVGVRSVLSLVKAQKREPMPEPQTLLF